LVFLEYCNECSTREEMDHLIHYLNPSMTSLYASIEWKLVSTFTLLANVVVTVNDCQCSQKLPINQTASPSPQKCDCMMVDFLSFALPSWLWGYHSLLSTKMSLWPNEWPSTVFHIKWHFSDLNIAGTRLGAEPPDQDLVTVGSPDGLILVFRDLYRMVTWPPWWIPIERSKIPLTRSHVGDSDPSGAEYLLVGLRSANNTGWKVVAI